MSNNDLTLVTPTLERLHADADTNDPPIVAAAIEAAAARRANDEAAVAHHLVDAYIPIDPFNGRLVHTLACARRPGRIVEFGTSKGVSTIYLASALEPDEAPMITTEIEPTKADTARANLAEVGLEDRVDIRVGDAFETLADLDEPISLLFLDGWKQRYVPMLDLLEPLLVDGAWVVADDTRLFADACAPLIERLRADDSGYVSIGLPIGDGMELAVRDTARAAPDDDR